MAWNESGGNRKPDQDPWKGGGGRDQGPPDLDELLKQFQEKLNAFLGGKSRKGSNGNAKSDGSNSGGVGLILILLVLALGLWAYKGFYRVEQAEQALVLRFGKFHELNTAGLHWNPPVIDSVSKVNTQEISSYSHDSTMLTEDQNIVRVQLEVQYRVSDPEKYFLDIRDAEGALRQATESALRHVVGESEMDNVITEGRYALAQAAKVRLQSYLNNYDAGLLVTKVNMEDAHPPSEVKDAFDDVIKAKEDQVRKENEGDTYANRQIPKAQGKAQRLLEEAEAYKIEVIARANGEAQRFTQVLREFEKAPEVTRQRLYLETVEQVLSNSSKVLMDAKGNGNMTYLPIDKLLESSKANQERRSVGANPSDRGVSSSGPAVGDFRSNGASSNTIPYQGDTYKAQSYLNKGGD